MKRILCSIIAFGFAVIAATTDSGAADLPVKAPKLLPPPAVASWTGFYLGLGVGFRSTQTDATVVGITEAGISELAASCAFLAPFGGCVTGEPMHDTAFRFSPYLGFNWQFAPRWLLGIEGDVGFANRTTTLGGMYYPETRFMFGGGANAFSVKASWDASLRGRLGFLVTPWFLAYATGGAAWLHLEATSTCSSAVFREPCDPATGLSPAVITHSATRTGWTIGGGFEAALWSNWVARAEYRYADFGRWTNTDTRNGTDSGEVVSYELKVRTHTATWGVAYKFGDPLPAGDAAGAGAFAAVFKAPPAGLAPAVVASWSGLYLGAGAGVRSTKTDVEVTAATEFNINVFANCAASSVGCVTSEPFNGTAFRFSPYLGVNWQAAPHWVLGVEGDFGFADQTTTLAGMFAPFSTFMEGRAADRFSVKSTWDASARARVGYLVAPSILAYATGGAAWIHVETTSACNTDPVFGLCAPTSTGFNPAVISHAATRLGWTLGGGLEAMLWRNWMVRGEYRYADFGSFRASDVRLDALDGFFMTTSYDVRVRTHTATFGLAYKFDASGPGALVAKY